MSSRHASALPDTRMKTNFAANFNDISISFQLQIIGVAFVMAQGGRRKPAQHAVQHNPRGRLREAKACRRTGRFAPRRKAHRRRADASLQGAARARINRHRNFAHQFIPELPFVQTSQIIGPHQPNEAHPRIGRFQVAHRVDGVLRAEPCFFVGNKYFRMSGKRPTRGNPRCVIFRGMLFERVLRCLLYTSPSPRDLSTSRMPSSA